MFENGIFIVGNILQPYFAVLLISWVCLLIVLRDLDSDYYRETLCNYLNLRTALLSWSPCRMLRHFRMYLWANWTEENRLLNFIPRHLITFVQCIRGASLVTLRERSQLASSYLFMYNHMERTNPQKKRERERECMCGKKQKTK